MPARPPRNECARSFLEVQPPGPLRRSRRILRGGRGKVNAPSKSSREVRAGDEIALRQRGRITTIRVLLVAPRPPSKAEAASMYETLGIQFYDPEKF